MSKSWNIPGFDVYDPSLVLYAPLWRPDMVARGGSIKNGTGTMDVNPQALAVGANTITVTAAGTLIVAMPEGGTVASGTMTVTGSPVTVAAGIATTITTTGAIGNITVTPSNIIRSKDRNNRALTVAGATWGYQGRTFGGVDKTISMGTPSALAINGSTGFTIWGWLNIASDGENNDGRPWNKDSGAAGFHLATVFEAGGSVALDCYVRHNGGTHANGLTGVVVTINVSHFIVMRYNQNGDKKITVEVDGSNLAMTGADTAGVGNVADDSDVEYLLGDNGASARCFDGTIGEASQQNKLLTTQETQQIRNATRWRYQ